jgi:hypothetical protein
MTEHTDGGPAFPCNELNADGSLYAQHFGVSLRDYFAAEAMKALLHPGVTWEWMLETYGTEHVSAAAYDQADAMLAERAKGKS